jgi:hypothetical protein
MRLETHTRSYWLILACSLLGAAAFAFFAITLIIQAVSGTGSHAGNILRIGLGIVSLFMGIFFVAVGTLYVISFDEADGNEFR